MTGNNNINNFGKYSKEKVKKGVELALKLFMYKDFYLIKEDLHEMAITHKLAIYLGYVFSDYDVDCEWNRNISNMKGFFKEDIVNTFEQIVTKRLEQENTNEIRTKGLVHELEEILASIRKYKISAENCKVDLENKERVALKKEQNELLINRKIRPDIIIHKRGDTEHNLVAIEVKKKNANDTKKYEVNKCFDLGKLHEMTTQENFKYPCGFYIELPEHAFKHANISIEKSQILSQIFGETENKVFEIKFTNKN